MPPRLLRRIARPVTRAPKGSQKAAAGKKGAAAAEAGAPKQKAKKGEQLAGPTPETGEAIHQHTLRGKQRQAKAHEEAASPPHPAPAHQAPTEETKQTVALTAPQQTATPPAPAPSAATETPVTLNIPMPELPEGPPSDLVQSLFSSSPLP
jgi:hypothetical protein